MEQSNLDLPPRGVAGSTSDSDSDSAGSSPAGAATAVAVARDEPPNMLALIAAAAANPAIDVDKMKALLDMQERLEDRQREAAFNVAFARLQARLPRIKKNGLIEYPPNPDAKTAAGRKGSKTPYAKWEDIMAAILPLVHEEGFALTYDAPPVSDGRISCKATLIHCEGHSRSSTFGPMPLDTSGGKNNLQGAGSTDSYGKRFATRDLLNLVYEGEDDDGVKGGAEYIGADELRELDELRRELGVDLDSFCRTLTVESLVDLPKSSFPIAMNLLAARKRRRQGGEP